MEPTNPGIRVVDKLMRSKAVDIIDADEERKT